MIEVPDFIEVGGAKSASEAVARWWGGLLLTGIDVNHANEDMPTRAGGVLREMMLSDRRPLDAETIRGFVGVLADIIVEDYEDKSPFSGVTRGFAAATDGNGNPSKLLFRAAESSGVPTEWPTFPDDGLAYVQNDVAYAKLGRMEAPVQIWPPLED